MWFDKLLSVITNPKKHADMIAIIGYDPIIAIENGQDVKISGLWSKVPEKKLRAESSFTKYTLLFRNLHEKIIDETTFVEQMWAMTPEGADILKLFNLLQSFHELKGYKEDCSNCTINAFLQPVQDQDVINAIKAVIGAVNMSLEISTGTAPFVANVVVGEENPDVSLAGDCTLARPSDNTELD